MRLIVVLTVGIVAGLLLSNSVSADWALGVMRTLSPLGLRGTALMSFALALSVIVLLTLVSEGGFRKGELTTAVPSFFAFYAFFFGMVYWLFA